MFSILAAFLSGLVTRSIKNPSKRQTMARMMKGISLPPSWYKMPPKGGATKQPNEMQASAMPNAFVRAPSSLYLEEVRR